MCNHCEHNSGHCEHGHNNEHCCSKGHSGTGLDNFLIKKLVIVFYRTYFNDNSKT